MAFCCYRAPPQALRRATVLPCCRHYCHCLNRGSSNEAGIAICGGCSSSGSGSGGGSGAILLLVIVVILLLLITSMVGRCVAALHLNRGQCRPRSSPSSSSSLLGAPRRRDHCPPHACPRPRPRPHPHHHPHPHPHPCLHFCIALATRALPLFLAITL